MLINQLELNQNIFFVNSNNFFPFDHPLDPSVPPQKMRQYRSVASYGATIGGTKFRSSGEFPVSGGFAMAVSSRNPETEWTLSHG